MAKAYATVLCSLLVILVSGCSGSPTAPSDLPGSWFAPAVPLPTTDARFDGTFYDALVHGARDFAASSPLRRLTVSPSVYLQRTGLSDAFVAQLEQTFREEIPAFTGGALSLARFETGDTLRPDAAGWIVIELRADDTAACGLTKLGASAGHMWINTTARCARRGEPVPFASLFAHEMGHALGFYHVDSGLMQPDVTFDQQLTERERFHGAIAYTQPVVSLR